MTSSLRRRILIGSVLWTVGMICLASAVFSKIVEVLPHPHHILQSPVMLLFGIACLALGAWHVRRGLVLIDRLRAQLASLRTGRERRIEGDYPGEIQPLVNDLNALLDHRDRAVQRALAKAGDLAHGLKTPLTILTHEAERAQSEGQTHVADAVRQQVERMRRQVDYHLAQARAAASGATPGTRASVRESATGLARAMEHLHAESAMLVDVTVPADVTVAVQREDLDEMLGNLLDNACKWGRSRVTVQASTVGSHVHIIIDDDGPGLPEAMREAVLQRGVRADETTPGWGLGLAIVSDLVDVYGGSIALEGSPDGGLRARLQLPA